jgi:hypothetical protein
MRSRGGHVLSRGRPSAPSQAKRSGQRQTAVLLLPVGRTIAFLPSPSPPADDQCVQDDGWGAAPELMSMNEPLSRASKRFSRAVGLACSYYGRVSITALSRFGPPLGRLPRGPVRSIIRFAVVVRSCEITDSMH